MLTVQVRHLASLSHKNLELVIILLHNLAPPGPVTDLAVVESDSNSITITWKRPSTAGKNLHYEILLCDTVSVVAAGRAVELSLENDQEIVTYTLFNLRAFTDYAIKVITHNSVSDQDPDNADRRIVLVGGKTKEGGEWHEKHEERRCELRNVYLLPHLEVLSSRQNVTPFFSPTQFLACRF